MRVFLPDLIRCFLYSAFFLFLPLSTIGDIRLDGDGEWNLYGRFRLRIEQDNEKGAETSDRSRIRIGNFAGLRFTPDDQWELNVRGRVGDRRDPRIVDMTVHRFDDFSLGNGGPFSTSILRATNSVPQTRSHLLAAMSSYATTSFGWLQRSNVRVHDFRADYSLSDAWRMTGRMAPAKNIIGPRRSTRFRIDFSHVF